MTEKLNNMTAAPEAAVEVQPDSTLVTSYDGLPVRYSIEVSRGDGMFHFAVCKDDEVLEMFSDLRETIDYVRRSLSGDLKDLDLVRPQQPSSSVEG